MKKIMVVLSIVMLSCGIAFADYQCSVTGNVSTSARCSGSTFYVNCENHNNYPVNITVPVVLVDVEGNPCRKAEYNKYIEAGKSIEISFRHSSKKSLDCDECSVQAVSVVKCK